MRSANEEKGEVNLTAGDKTYVLRLSNQAICEAQARTGKTWGQLLTAADSLDYVAYRDVVSVMLRAYHAKEFPNLVTVSALIDDVGMPRISQAMERIFELNSEQAKVVAEEIKAEKAARRPLEAATPSIGAPPMSPLDAVV